MSFPHMLIQRFVLVYLEWEIEENPHDNKNEWKKENVSKRKEFVIST